MTIQELHDITEVLIAQNMGDAACVIATEHSCRHIQELRYMLSNTGSIAMIGIVDEHVETKGSWFGTKVT